jgi:hypothetical protein
VREHPFKARDLRLVPPREHRKQRLGFDAVIADAQLGHRDAEGGRAPPTARRAALDERDALQELEDRKRARERNARLAGKLARGATGGRGAQEFPDFHRLGVTECVEKSRR